MPRFAALLACRLSGQIPDAAWDEHLTDELFCAWLRRKGYA